MKKHIKNDLVNLVIFGSAGLLKTTLLTNAVIEYVRRCPGWRIVAIVDTNANGLDNPNRRRSIEYLRRFIYWVIAYSPLLSSRVGGYRRLQILAASTGLKLLIPPNRNINAPCFVRQMAEIPKPCFALSLGCEQIFSNALLSAFTKSINNHSGLLPGYKGWASTEWSIYCGEAITGASFHYMTSEVDGGRVLAQVSVPVGDRSIDQINLEKYTLAANKIGEVLDTVRAGGPGVQITQESLFFTRSKTEKIQQIDHPEDLKWDELQRRLRAFGSLCVNIQGRRLFVKKMRIIPRGSEVNSETAFITRDGQTVSTNDAENSAPSLSALSRKFSFK